MVIPDVRRERAADVLGDGGDRGVERVTQVPTRVAPVAAERRIPSPRRGLRDENHVWKGHRDVCTVDEQRRRVLRVVSAHISLENKDGDFERE